MRSTPIVAALCLLSLLPVTSTAQPATVIPDEVSCAACRITTATPLTLRVPVEHALASVPQLVRADSKARIWMLDRASVLVFDSTGRFLTAIGREGRGPNEYQGPAEVLVLPGDSVLLIDPQNARASVISPQLEYVRSISFPFAFGRGAVLRWPDSVLFSGRASGANLRAPSAPLHLASFRDPMARIIASYSPHGTATRPGYSSFIIQHISRDPRGRIITVEYLAYDISVWSQLGAERRDVQRRPTWFAQPTSVGMGPKEPPPPGIKGIATEGENLLWVATSVPAATWASAWKDASAIGGEIRTSSIALERLYDTMLEILDPVAGSVVARLKLNGFIIGLLPGGRLVKYDVDMIGEPRVSIIQASVVAPGR